MTASTEVIRRIFLDGEGVCLEIGPWDVPGVIELRTVDAKSSEWFGKINLSMDKDLALALGNALIAAAKEQA